MKTTKLLFFLILLISLLQFSTSCNEAPQSAENSEQVAENDQEAMIKHGEYLVTIMGCNDCHSPKRMGARGPEIITELMLSGYPSDRPVVAYKDSIIQQGFAMFYPDLTAAIGPWGTTFAGNLTPDDSGIGTWSEEQFKKALTEGKFKGMDNNRMLLPPMPVENYRNMKDEDVAAIFQYLKSLTPVKNVVPAPIPPSES
jgi:mono/diheme cytochrome c family protein